MRRLIKAIKRFFPIITAIIVFALIVPGLVAFIAKLGVPIIIKLLGIPLSPSFTKLFTILPLLFYRPEAFIYLGKIHSSPIILFIIFWVWTTGMTAITWFGLKWTQERLKHKTASVFGQFFIFIQDFMDRSVKKWGRYVVFITFMPPVPLPVMGLDTLSVITARLLNIKYGFWIFIALNAVKALIYLELPMIPFLVNLFK